MEYDPIEDAINILNSRATITGDGVAMSDDAAYAAMRLARYTLTQAECDSKPILPFPNPDSTHPDAKAA